MHSNLNPSQILNQGFGFFASKVLLSAVKLELFTALGDKRLSGEELQAKLRRTPMKSTGLGLALMLLPCGLPALAQEPGMAKRELLLQETVQGMPRGEEQELRVLTASFEPGDKTVFHTHRFPVIVYVLEGTFTLELEGRNPIAVSAGHALVEPPNVKMTGYNRSASERLRAVIFYTSDPDTPFFDLAKHP